MNASSTLFASHQSRIAWFFWIQVVQDDVDPLVVIDAGADRLDRPQRWG